MNFFFDARRFCVGRTSGNPKNQRNRKSEGRQTKRKGGRRTSENAALFSCAVKTFRLTYQRLLP